MAKKTSKGKKRTSREKDEVYDLILDALKDKNTRKKVGKALKRGRKRSNSKSKSRSRSRSRSRSGSRGRDCDNPTMNFTRDQLIRCAKKKGMYVYPKWTKAEIINALNNFRGENDVEEIEIPIPRSRSRSRSRGRDVGEYPCGQYDNKCPDNEICDTETGDCWNLSYLKSRPDEFDARTRNWFERREKNYGKDYYEDAAGNLVGRRGNVERHKQSWARGKPAPYEPAPQAVIVPRAPPLPPAAKRYNCFDPDQAACGSNEFCEGYEDNGNYYGKCIAERDNYFDGKQKGTLVAGTGKNMRVIVGDVNILERIKNKYNLDGKIIVNKPMGPAKVNQVAANAAAAINAGVPPKTVAKQVEAQGVPVEAVAKKLAAQGEPVAAAEVLTAAEEASLINALGPEQIRNAVKEARDIIAAEGAGIPLAPPFGAAPRISPLKGPTKKEDMHNSIKAAFEACLSIPS